MVKIISGNDFEEEVLKSRDPVLVDFYADWCPPCRALSPIIEEIAESGKIKVVKVNVDDAREVAIRYKIFSIPTLMIFVDGEPVDSIIGLSSKEDIEAWIERVVG